MIPLAGSGLADCPANPTLGIPQLVAKNHHRFTPTSWAYKFFCRYLNRFFHDLHVNTLVSYNLSEALVFFLKAFEFFDQLWTHPAVFLSPSIVGPFADLGSR